MHKVSVIANREYRAMVRTKAFLLTVVLMPVLMCGALIVQRFLEGRVNIEDKTLVVVDATGRCFDDLVVQAERRNEYDIIDPDSGRQVVSRFILERGPSGPILGREALALSERVRLREITAFAEILPRALDPEVDPTDGPFVRFYSESPITSHMRRWFIAAVNEVIRTTRLRDAGVDVSLVMKASRPVTVADLGLFTTDESNAVVPAEPGTRDLAVFIPVMLLMLMFMAIMVASQPMLQSVIEEKQQRIAEVLLGSATPWEIMMGKLLGNVAVALTLVGVYLLGGYLLALFLDQHHQIPTHMFGWFIVYQALGVMLYGSVFISIGAACSDLKDAQSFLMPVMLLLVMPMMVWLNVLRDPLSDFATWLSFFPPATPMLMVLRLATTTALPLWQPLLGIVVVLLTTLAGVWGASRIFRIGILAQGKTPKAGELARWILRG